MENLARLLFLLVIALHGNSIYLPGLAPINYCAEADQAAKSNCKSIIPLYMNKLDSTRSILSYNYDMFDLCTSSSDDWPAENLGQVVFGERLRPSNFDISFGKAVDCKILCKKSYTPQKSANLTSIRQAILLRYQQHWIVDNLPVTLCLSTADKRKHCTASIPLGCAADSSGVLSPPCQQFTGLSTVNVKPKASYLLNHVNLRIAYHRGGNEWAGAGAIHWGRIVSITAEPRSIDHGAQPDCLKEQPLELPARLTSNIDITYTYSVTFEEDPNMKWSSRWDYILNALPHSKIQWLSIVNSLVLVLFLSGLLATILLRTLRRDIARYTQLESATEAQEESGWKLIHGDVFRPPSWGMLLSVLLGSGTQIFVMLVVTLFFACIGFLSPASRGALMTCALALFACLGSPAGYVSARIYKLFGGMRWKSNVVLTATFCPALVFGMFFVLNLVLWGLNSASTVPFGTIVALLAMWLCVSLPLCFLGAFFGFRRPTIEVPVRTNQIPRQIPPQSFYSRPTAAFFMGGMLPFSCIFVQLFFIFNSIWGTQFYYMFGFLFIVFIILVITCSETSILMCYFHLCAEDYRWWWRAFCTGGGTAFYLFLYSLHYFITRLDFRDAASFFLYFGYTLILVWLSFLLTGTIGFMACLWFVRKVYSAVKVD